MKRYIKPPTPEDLQKEYRIALQTNPVKAKELKKKIDYFNYGIK